MKKITSAYRSAAERAIHLRASTGSHCPANGFWRTADLLSDPIFVFEGSMMPPGKGGSTMWFLDEAHEGPPAYPLPGR